MGSRARGESAWLRLAARLLLLAEGAWRGGRASERAQPHPTAACHPPCPAFHHKQGQEQAVQESLAEGDRQADLLEKVRRSL